MRIVNPIGKKGEDIAVVFLKKKGWRILERNFRKQYGEIDIIAIDKSEKEPILVFVEVKTRTSNLYGTPLEAITHWKIKPLEKTMQLYIAEHPGLPEALRMDAIAVTLDKDMQVVAIEHIENIS